MNPRGPELNEEVKFPSFQTGVSGIFRVTVGSRRFAGQIAFAVE